MSTSPLAATVSNQFIRAYSLTLAGQSGQVIDLSQLHFTFEVAANDVETPNTAHIRVYNLSDAHLSSIPKEFDTVQLQAGYQNGNFSQIFNGVVKQYRRGRERNVDSFLDILAADSDAGYNFGVVNAQFPKGTPTSEQLQTYAQALGVTVDPNADSFLTGGVLLNPRGKTAFGLVRVYMRDLADSNNVRWSLQNGVLTLVPLTGFLPGPPTVVNAKTGLIGVPEATDDGIKLKTLLNPAYQVGYLVKIDSSLINKTDVINQFFPGFTSQATFVARVTDDGLYRILVVEHEGDTRGGPWYTNLTCLAVDATTSSSNPQQSVAPFGDGSNPGGR